jgi:hypothetical protein
MRVLVVLWRKSGQPAERFAREHGVNPKSFHYWKRKFGAVGVGPDTRSRAAAGTLRFKTAPEPPPFAKVLLTHAGCEARAAVPSSQGHAEAVIAIELATGDRVRVEGLATPGPVLVEVLAALGRRASC